MKILYSKVSDDRKKEFQIKTLIYKDNDANLKVKKEAIYEVGKDNIKRIYDNGCLLKDLYDDKWTTGALVGDAYIADYFDYRETIGNRIDREIRNNQWNKVKADVDFWKALIIGREDNLREFTLTEQFEYIFGKVDFDGALATKISNLDCNSENILVGEGGKVKVIDYEWVFNVPIPLEFIFYYVASLFINNRYDENTRQRFMALFDLPKESYEIYNQMIGNFSDYIKKDCTNGVDYSRVGDYFLKPQYDEESESNLRYKFSYNNLAENSLVLVYGAGTVGKECISWVKNNDRLKYAGVIDLNADRYRKLGLVVYDVGQIAELKFDYIIVAVKDEATAKEIISNLTLIGVDNQKLLWEPIIKR